MIGTSSGASQASSYSSQTVSSLPVYAHCDSLFRSLPVQQHNDPSTVTTGDFFATFPTNTLQDASPNPSSVSRFANKRLLVVNPFQQLMAIMEYQPNPSGMSSVTPSSWMLPTQRQPLQNYHARHHQQDPQHPNPKHGQNFLIEGALQEGTYSLPSDVSAITVDESLGLPDFVSVRSASSTTTTSCSEKQQIYCLPKATKIEGTTGEPSSSSKKVKAQLQPSRRPTKKYRARRTRTPDPNLPVPSMSTYNFFYRWERQRILQNVDNTNLPDYTNWDAAFQHGVLEEYWAWAKHRTVKRKVS